MFLLLKHTYVMKLFVLFALVVLACGRPSEKAPPASGCRYFLWMYFGQNPSLPLSDYRERQKGPIAYLDNQDGVTLVGKSLQIEYYAIETGVPVKFMLLKPTHEDGEDDPHRHYEKYGELVHTANEKGYQEVKLKVDVVDSTRIAFEVEGNVVPIPYARGGRPKYSSLEGYKMEKDVFVWNKEIVNKKFAFRLGMFAGILDEQCAKTSSAGPETTYPNMCDIDNGGCDHICVSTPVSYYCKCREGYNLLSDGHTCSDCIGREWICYGQHPGGLAFPSTRHLEEGRENYIAFVDNQDGIVTETHETIQFEYYASYPGTTVTFMLLEPQQNLNIYEEPNQFSVVYKLNHTAFSKGFNYAPFKFIVHPGLRIAFEVESESNPIPYRKAPYRYSTYEGVHKQGSLYVFQKHYTDRSYQFRLCVLHDYVKLTCPTSGPYVDLCAKNNGGCEDQCKWFPSQRMVMCHCRKSGYAIGEDEKSCVDVDECTSGSHSCQHKCLNTEGSYRCECNPGYTLERNLFDCFEINECTQQNGGCEHKCTNTKGSYKCSCKNGYKLSSDGHKCTRN